MTRNIVPFGLRMQEELKFNITRSAYIAGRSMNAEIINRLKASFEERETAPLPFAVQQAVDDMVEETSCTPEEALTTLVLKGQSQGGTVLNIHVGPNTTVKQVREAINAAQGLIPDNAGIIFERK